MDYPCPVVGKGHWEVDVTPRYVRDDEKIAGMPLISFGVIFVCRAAYNWRNYRSTTILCSRSLALVISKMIHSEEFTAKIYQLS